jgi:hypothetical protein
MLPWGSGSVESRSPVPGRKAAEALLGAPAPTAPARCCTALRQSLSYDYLRGLRSVSLRQESREAIAFRLSVFFVITPDRALPPLSAMER